MTFLLRLTLAVMIVAALAVTGVRLAGGAGQPLNFFASTFLTNPDGSFCRWPCMFGIRPGITRYADALDMLQSNTFARYLPRPFRRGLSSWYGNGFNLIISDYDGNQVRTTYATSMYVNFAVPQTSKTNASTPLLRLSVGEIVGFLGKPEAIYSRNGEAWLYYPANRLIVEVTLLTRDTAHIDSTDPDLVNMIFLPQVEAFNLPN
jgi:hypothetical protein